MYVIYIVLAADTNNVGENAGIIPAINAAKNKNPYILIPMIMFAVENFIDYQIMSFHFITFMCMVCHMYNELDECKTQDEINIKYLIPKEGTNS